MYISIYFPVSDFRDLQEVQSIRRPTWPVFKTGSKPFQQNLGLIRDRPLGGIRGWIQEGTICEIGKSIEISHKPKTKVLKRFYFDGTFSGYFSLGFSGLLSKQKRSYNEIELNQLVADIVTRSVRSRHAASEVSLLEYGKFATEIYANGATSVSRQELACGSFSRWIQTARPLVVFELPSDRVSASIKHSKFKLWPFLQNKVRFISKENGSPQEFEIPVAIIEKKSRSEDKFARQARMVLARLYCEFCLLEDAVDLLASRDAFEIADSQNDYFCGRISESLSRLTGAKRLSALRDPDFYNVFTRVFLDGFDTAKIEALAQGLDVHGARRNLRESLLKSHLWMKVANQDQFEIVKEKVMSKYVNEGGVVGAMGDNARADQSTFTQNVGVEFSSDEMAKLVDELERLKAALVSEGSTNSLSAAAAISEAKDSAASQNSSALVTSLKKAGKWAFDVATKIGVAAAAAAIKKAAGL